MKKVKKEETSVFERGSTKASESVMASMEGWDHPHSKLGLASCGAFGLAVFLMLTLNAMLGNLGVYGGKVDTHDSAVKPAFVSAVYTIYADVPINLLGIVLAVAGLLKRNCRKTASWAGLAMNGVSLVTLLGCYGIVSWMTGIK
jgi:hypothetical protein